MAKPSKKMIKNYDRRVADYQSMIKSLGPAKAAAYRAPGSRKCK